MKKKFILLAMMLLTLIGGVNLNVLNAQQQYRIKFPTLEDYYLTIFNNDSHPAGPVGGVGVDVYKESNTQKFTIETGANGGVYLKSADGYYIYCNGGSGGWNVDAINSSDKSELYGFDMTGGSFKIYDDNGYIKVQDVNSAYYIFHNASSAQGASWQLVEVPVNDGIIPAAPTNLVATAIDYKSISLTWTAGDENALEYNIYQGGVNIGSTTETSYTVEGLTAETNYCFTVEAVRGVNVSESHSDEACVTTPERVILPGPQEQEIGKGSTTSNSYLPAYTYYGHSYSQQIYTKEEIDFVPGVVTKIAFKQKSGNGIINRNYKVYLVNTTKETFASGSDWVSLTTDDCYFDGQVTYLGADQWLVINLTEPFQYEGNNILVAVDDDLTSGYPYSDFYAYTTNSRSISVYNDNNDYSISNTGSGTVREHNNQVIFTIEVPTPSIEVNYTSLDFGTVRAGGDFWTEKETRSFYVNVKAKNTAIKTITGNDDFFKFSDVSGATDQTEFNFTVSYNKAAAAGEKSGNIVVTYMNGEEEATVEIPMTATAYVPAQGDVVENPKAVTFTEGAYTDNVTGVYDDYILPGEENDGNNGDAVYTFTLTEESLISANVDGTNGLVAIYKAADLEGNGPSSENSFAGNDDVPEVSMTPTTFFNGFETGDFTGWQNIDKDGDGNKWNIIQGGYGQSQYYVKSDSYISPHDLTPENYLVTDKKYYITSNSKLTVCATSHNKSWKDGFNIEVSEDLINFNVVKSIQTTTANDLIPYEIDLKDYAGREVYIAINHNTAACYALYIDNIELTDGSKSRSLAQTRSTSPQIENVYPAGTYYLVAAAEGDFTLNISTGDIPAPEATTYVSPENNATEVADATLVFQLGKYTDEYQVLVGISADALETVVDWTSELATTYTLADAANNTKYYWQVNTRNAKDVETTGEVWSFVTPLDVPQNVTATATKLYPDNNTTTISWSALESATLTGYNVYVNDVKQNAELLTATSMTLAELPYGLNPGNLVEVKAVHGDLGESPAASVYVEVAGSFPFTLTVTNGTNPIEGATVRLINGVDEFGVAIEEVTLTTNAEGVATATLPLLATSKYYDIIISKEYYETTPIDALYITYWQVSNGITYDLSYALDMAKPTNVVASPAYIHVGESTTISWTGVEGDDVTYNVYVDGVKHNTEAVEGTSYTISGLAYNKNGYAVTVTAEHALGETPASYATQVYVGGTFTLTVNVTDGTKPIEGAEVTVKGDNYTYDEFGNLITAYEPVTTNADGVAVIENVKLLQSSMNGYSCYYITASYGLYNDGNETLTNYTTISDGGNVTKTITMTLPSPVSVITSEDHYFVGEDVTLSWEAPTLNTRAFLGYNVYQANYGEDITKLNEEPLTETSYTITGLDYGSYNFGVSAVYDEGESSYQTTFVKVTGYSEITGFVKDDNNEPIKGVSITVEGYNEFYEEVTYTATSDASGVFSIENVMLSSWEGYTLTATKFDYQETIVTGIEVGYGTPTHCNVTMQTLPGGTFAVTASEVDENVEVTWDVPTGGVAYNVYRRFDGDVVTPLTTEEITTQSFTDETWSTLADGEYEYGVSAKIEERFNFKESFANGIPADWKTYRLGDASAYYDAWIWKAAAATIDGISAYDGDNGIAMANNNKGTGTTRKAYMVTSLIDLTEAVNPTMSFVYHTPYYSTSYTSTGYTNELRVLVLTEAQGQDAGANGTQLWTNGSIYTTWWDNAQVDLSAYQGQKIYIAFENTPKFGNGTSIDYVEITSDATTYTTGVSWADPIIKGGIEFLATADGNWNEGSNWSTGEVPSATDKVTIKGNAVITENVNINTITIADGASLTLESGVLTAEIINNKNAEAFVIEDGAQLFQNNSDVAATFNMDVVNPTGEWSNSNQTGWQFVASPFTDATIASFLPSEGDYDLYKYDGTQNLEWVNHKYHGNSGGSFNYNFENGLIPSEIIQIDNDGDGKKWGVVGDYNNGYTYPQNIVGSVACLYSESYYATANTDNYLVLPKSFVVEGSVLSFQITNYFSYAYGYSEQYQVLVSETTPELAEFEPITDVLTTATSNNSSGVFVWEDKEYDLSAYNGKEIYIAIRHINNNNSGKSALVLDNIKLVRGEFDEFELEFEQGRAYLASYETETVASLEGTLNNASSHTWELSYNAEKPLANFHLLGNPFTFDMDVTAATFNNLFNGVAIVNNEGGYTYDVKTIPVGDGFFVQAIGENPSLLYGGRAAKSEKSNNSLNITATGNAGKDNVVINFAGKSEGFNKLQNFNDAIATVYVAEDGNNYGIYNCDADVQEVELSFNANKMGNYTISIEPNGKFQTVTLVDRFTGVETNMLVEDYTFTAMSEENPNRFIVRFANGQQTTDNSHFVYQSGEELILNIQGEVQIVDVLGRVVYNGEAMNDINRINVSSFNSGAYMVKVMNGNEVKVEKVVIY